jgi:hypothetical protein
LETCRRTGMTPSGGHQPGFASRDGKHNEGGHWLGSFAVYLVTKRGIPQK